MGRKPEGGAAPTAEEFITLLSALAAGAGSREDWERLVAALPGVSRGGSAARSGPSFNRGGRVVLGQPAPGTS